MDVKEKLGETIFKVFFFILMIIYFLIPKPLLYKMLYDKEACEACGRRLLRRRGWKKRWPKELLDLPLKCDECCSPAEVEERERIADKYIHII